MEGTKLARQSRSATHGMSPHDVKEVTRFWAATRCRFAKHVHALCPITGGPTGSGRSVRRSRGARALSGRGNRGRGGPARGGAQSSLVNGLPCSRGSRLSTDSEGLHRATPSGVTTMGRLVRMGCSIIASSSWSSVSLWSSSPSSSGHRRPRPPRGQGERTVSATSQAGWAAPRRAGLSTLERFVTL